MVNSSLNYKIIKSDHYSYLVVNNAYISFKKMGRLNVENKRRKEKQVEKWEGFIIYKIFVTTSASALPPWLCPEGLQEGLTA